MISGFDTFSAERAETNSLAELDGMTIAIEANFFLQRYFDRQKTFYEGLLPALGGLPFGLREYLQKDLETLTQSGIKPIFVFDGLDVGKKHKPFARTNEAVIQNAAAWDYYFESQQLDARPSAESLYNRFRECDWVKPEVVYRLFQTVLHTAKIQFLVAPYSANAQIAYMNEHGTDWIDAVAGSSELLLYEIDKVITELDVQKKEFTWIRRQHWIERLQIPSADLFVDACILSGSDLMEPLPILIADKEARLREALALLTSNGGKSGAAVCKDFQDQPAMVQLNYLDRYCRNRLSVKHHVILTSDGQVEPLDPSGVPNDLHTVIGQRLPEELYYYLSIGAVGPRLLTHVTSQHIYETVSADGGKSSEYQKLLREKLLPIRQKTLSLLSSSLHRGYQYKQISYKFWFDEDAEVTFKAADIASPASSKTWKVPGDVLNSSGLPLSTSDQKPSLAFCLGSLQDNSFVSKTLPQKGAKLLQNGVEVSTNVIWRFLHVREYVEDKHQLTGWGKVLAAMLDSFGSECTSELEEACLFATELLRLDLLSSKRMYPQYSKQAIFGGESDQLNCLLLSRIGCLGRLQNKQRGYSGRLSRSLLGYNAMITATQQTLRDLLESCFATMLLNGDVTRTGIDLANLGLDLPLLLPLNTALGLAVNNYLDDVTNHIGMDDEAFEQEKKRLKTPGSLASVPSALDLAGDLAKVWSMFDAIYAGVKVAAEHNLITKKVVEDWAAVVPWLEKRK